MSSQLPDSDANVSRFVHAALLLAACEPARQLGLAHPTLDQILAATGATRSRTYELRDALNATLPTLQRRVGRPAATPSIPTVDQYQALLGIARDVIGFIIAQPGCVRGQHRVRYADVFRRHVLELRATHCALPLKHFAEAVGVPLETLEDWLRAGVLSEESPDRTPVREEVDNKDNVSSAHIQTVLTEWKQWEGGFTDFCTHVKTNCHVPYGATLVSTILSSHGARVPARREGRSPDERALRDAFHVFFPDAQWVGDGSQVSIDVCGSRFDFNLELLVDTYSDAFVGVSLRDEEDSAAVIDAMLDAKRTTNALPPLPLALLLDNKPSNHIPEVDAALGDTTRMRATPARPQNKAHVEGAFGLFQTTVPPLLVGGTDAREIARSILALVITTFFRAANHRPRADRNGRSRVAIHDEKPTPEQIDSARKDLNERCRRQELARETREARQDPEVRAYLDRAFARLELLDPERSIRIAIARYPFDAIVDGIGIFGGKRLAGTLPPQVDARYLLGIVRNDAAQREGMAIFEALLRGRMEVRDILLGGLRAERSNVERDTAPTDAQLKAFVDRACDAKGKLDRCFWLITIVDTIRAQPSDVHETLMRAVAVRINATFRIAPAERLDAVRFVVDRVVPLR